MLAVVALAAGTRPFLGSVQKTSPPPHFDRFLVNATNLWFAFRLEILGVALAGGFIILLTLNPDSTSPTRKAVSLTFGLQTIGILGMHYENFAYARKQPYFGRPNGRVCRAAA